MNHNFPQPPSQQPISPFQRTTHRHTHKHSCSQNAQAGVFFAYDTAEGRKVSPLWIFHAYHSVVFILLCFPAVAMKFVVFVPVVHTV